MTLIKKLMFMFVTLSIHLKMAHAQEACDLGSVQEQNPRAFDQSFGEKKLIANPYFARRLWQEFCASALKAGDIRKARFHPFLYSMNIAGLLECRMFKLGTDQSDDEIFYQCAIKEDAGWWKDMGSLVVDNAKALHLWNYWQQSPKALENEEQKRLDAVHSMGTAQHLFFADDTLVCYNRPSGLTCRLDNDSRNRAL